VSKVSGKWLHCHLVTPRSGNVELLHVGWAGTFAHGGGRTMRNAVMRPSVGISEWAGTCHPQKCPFSWGI